MRIWIYYTRLAITDLFRLWSSTQHHVIIVAGICLPILLLLGLKGGHVAELRRELLTSPTGRQIIFYSAQSDSFITTENADKLEKQFANIELVIPELQRLVTLRKKTEKKQSASTKQQRVTLYPTRPGDPILAQFDADILKEKERGLVLTKVAAESLGVKVGDTVDVNVERRRSGVSETASVDLKVRSIVEFSAEDENIGYVPLPLIAQIEQYVRGFKVDELGWPAMKTTVQDRYASYLLFCRFGNDLSAKDKLNFAELDRVLKPVTDKKLKSLFGLIRPEAVDKLIVYEVFTAHSREDYKHRISMTPSDFTINLIESKADPVVIPWNKPARVKMAGGSFLAIGVTVSERNWLRNHLVDRKTAFGFDNKTYSAKRVRDGKPVPLPEGPIALTLSDGQQFKVKRAVSEEPNPGGSDCQPKPDPAAKEKADAPAKKQTTESTSGDIIVLPADLLAQLDAYRSKQASFDVQSGLFVPVPETVRFDKARVYASSIDDVPQIVKMLLGRDFAVESENGRIMEIHEQDHSLQLLVYVVGTGVFLFGVVTVFSVLLDSTDRKRGAIGILRVMGMSRRGIFYVVILRAILIGLLAGVVTIAVGKLVAWILAMPSGADSFIGAWKPTITILILMQDVFVVFSGALLVAGIGALVPAFRASRMDPFEAIVEGRFR